MTPLVCYNYMILILTFMDFFKTSFAFIDFLCELSGIFTENYTYKMTQVAARAGFIIIS